MATFITNNLIYSEGFLNFHPFIKERFSKYKYVYISVGSKWNEKTYEYMEYGKTFIRRTNSHLQMIPNFTKDRKGNVLIIAMDEYNNRENLESNYEIAKKYLEPNMEFVFYNDNESLRQFMGCLTELLTENKIPPENFVIMNFVRFQRPNILETSTEQKIPEIINNGLKETVYAECFYQWFGYQENLYNMVYNYNRYNNRHTYMHRFTEIACGLNTLLHSEILGTDNLAYVYEYYLNQPNHSYFDIFLKNVVDISSFFRNESKICCSLMESLDF